MWRKVGGAIIVLLVIVAGAYGYFIARIEHGILASIEKNGSEAATTKVAAESVALSLLSGKCVITGLTIGNPPGFSTPYAVMLGTITVHAQFSSYFGDGPLIVDEVVIDRPHIYYEIRAGLTDLSLKSLNLGSSSNLGVLGRDAQDNAGSPDTGPVRKEIIKALYVRNGQVSIATTLLKGRQLTENLSPIHLTGIGEGTGGVTTGRVTAQVLTAITGEAALEGAASLVKAIGTAGVGPLGNALVNTVKSLF